MRSQHKISLLLLRRRDLGVAALAVNRSTDTGSPDSDQVPMGGEA